MAATWLEKQVPDPGLNFALIFFLFRIQERYRAIYDYDKSDGDEISLKEGDMISNGEIVGEGWMQATNMRTGETGMLPSNYVEKV
jgi:hypothetical protein